eukprot:8376705-Pyramimonas_sp.AAC.1
MALRAGRWGAFWAASPSQVDLLGDALEELGARVLEVVPGLADIEPKGVLVARRDPSETAAAGATSGGP